MISFFATEKKLINHKINTPTTFHQTHFLPLLKIVKKEKPTFNPYLKQDELL